MKVLLVAVLLAVSLDAAAASMPPPNFRESVRLTPIAEALSVPGAKVYCALTPASWRDTVEPLYPGLRWATLNGYAMVNEPAVYLSPWTCQPLERWKRGKTVPLADVGRALLTLGHESVHLRGVLDERTTECTALKELRSVARTHFGIKSAKVWRQVRDGALDSHVLVLDALAIPPC